MVFTNEASPHYMRLFTALDLPRAVRERYADLQAPEALDARWSSPDQFHVTVRFIGDVPVDQAERYESALSTLDAPPVECIPYGLDVLPSRHNPSVLVVGLERTPSLLSVYQAVSTALETEGLGPESRSYRPHVTLARLGNLPASTVHAFLKERTHVSLPSFSVDALHLYESTLTSDGAVHERRASFRLSH
jgi:2'-5' RNA ligase